VQDRHPGTRGPGTRGPRDSRTPGLADPGLADPGTRGPRDKWDDTSNTRLLASPSAAQAVLNDKN